MILIFCLMWAGLLMGGVVKNLQFWNASGTGVVNDAVSGRIKLTLDSTATGGAQARSIATFESETVKRINGRLMQGYINWEYCDSTRPGDSMFATVKTACVRGGPITAKILQVDTLTDTGFVEYNFTLDSTFRQDTWLEVMVVDCTNAAANCRPAGDTKTNYIIQSAMQVVGEGN